MQLKMRNLDRLPMLKIEWSESLLVEEHRSSVANIRAVWQQ